MGAAMKLAPISDDVAMMPCRPVCLACPSEMKQISGAVEASSRGALVDVGGHAPAGKSSIRDFPCACDMAVSPDHVSLRDREEDSNAVLSPSSVLTNQEEVLARLPDLLHVE